MYHTELDKLVNSEFGIFVRNIMHFEKRGLRRGLKG